MHATIFGPPIWDFYFIFCILEWCGTSEDLNQWVDLTERTKFIDIRINGSSRVWVEPSVPRVKTKGECKVDLFTLVFWRTVRSFPRYELRFWTDRLRVVLVSPMIHA